MKNIFRFCFYLFFVSRFCFIIIADSLTWKSDVSYPISIGGSIALTGQDNYIYVFGGYSGSETPGCYKFSVAAGSSREWISIAPMPISVYYAAGCVANDGNFFIFGGETINSSFPNVIQIYSPENDSWILRTPNMPSGTSIADFAFSCTIDTSTGLMYLVGGYNIGSRFYSYNISSNDITSFSQTIFQLSAHGSFVTNNHKLYVFGGESTLSPYLSSAKTYIYDIATKNWSTGGNMLKASSWFGSATDGSRFYAVGGYNDSINLQITQVYNISADVWSVDNGSVYSEGIDDNAVAILEGVLYSIGGVNSEGSYFPINRIALLCGVYTFSGPCDDENQCTFNDTCQNDGQCIGNANITCPTPLNPCQIGICNISYGCYLPNNANCDSKNFPNGICMNGQCLSCPQSSTSCLFNASTGHCDCIQSSSSSLSKGDIAGIVVSVLVFLLLASLAIVFVLKYQKRKKMLRLCNEYSMDSKIVSISNATQGTAYVDVSILPGTNLDPNITIYPSFNIPISSNCTYVLKWSKLEILKKVGEGSFGSVFLAKFNNTKVAVKLLLKKNVTEEDIKAFLAEAEIMRKLPVHPNVVLFRGITLPSDPLSIVTDFCEGGSLETYLEHNRNLSIDLKIQFIKDIAKGMLHLHCGFPEYEVIHRDLAARNILLNRGMAIITDFGLARVKLSVEDTKKTEQFIGPLKWMSPESIYERIYSVKSDVFSFAVVMYEIITQETPWKDLDPVQTAVTVKEGNRMTIPERYKCPESLMVLIEKCWAQHPEERPNFLEINEYLNKNFNQSRIELS